MDLKRVWMLCAANRSRFVIPAAALLLISVGWSIRSFQLNREQDANRLKEEHAEKVAKKLTADQARLAESTRRARDAKTDARVQQLYDEINQLTKLSEEVLLRDQATRTAAKAANNSENQAVRVR